MPDFPAAAISAAFIRIRTRRRLAQDGNSSHIVNMAIHLVTVNHNPRRTRHESDTEPPVSFNRSELAVILETYRRMVAAGCWCDYGISHLARAAVFSVFRHSAERPLYRIEKRPKAASCPNVFLIIAMDNRIVRHGHDLNQVMRYFDRNLFRVVA